MKINVGTSGGRPGPLCCVVFLLLWSPALQAVDQPAERLPSEGAVSHRAAGTFDVQLTPQAIGVESEDHGLSRMSIRKQFAGDLSGTSEGEMLAVVTPVEGSAVYVAVERVTGRLRDREGTFALQHRGTMTRGVQHLVITVVPDSGTGDLEGLVGEMAIQISEGKHTYTLEYSLPSPR